MRLFFALNFDESTKTAIIGVISSLQERTLSGNFTLRENLHLTLSFLGEVEEEEIPTLNEVMKKLVLKPIFLIIAGIGNFSNSKGSALYWLGIEKNNPLVTLVNQLSLLLEEAGFSFEKKNFVPHLTIGREIILKESFREKNPLLKYSPIKYSPHGVSLMESSRKDGILIYREINRRNL